MKSISELDTEQELRRIIADELSWRNIKTAPKGCDILGYSYYIDPAGRKTDFIEIIWWDEARQEFVDYDGYSKWIMWRHKPSPPTEGDIEREEQHG